MQHDPEIGNLIRKWRPPDPPEDARERMIARYRNRQSFWRRRIEFQVRIPLPAFAAAAAIVIASGIWWAQSAKRAPELQPVPSPRMTVTHAEARP